MILRIFSLLTLAVLLTGAHRLQAQVNLQTDGLIHRVDRTAGYQDFIIPSSLDPLTGYNRIDFYLRGGDGGRRRVSGICTEPGGEGATIIASFEIGSETGQLEPGGTIRFILGQKGDGIRSNGIAGAGGGGGSAILYKPPGLTLSSNPDNNTCTQTFNNLSTGFVTTKDVPSHNWNTDCWILLMVAGGGGGAYAPGGCVQNSSGKGGNDGMNGTDGKGQLGSAGKGGENGNPGNEYVGDGGGGTNLREFDGVKGEAGTLTEGRGGNSDGLTTTRAGDGYGGGGSGFRGVGAGGGGGGYSGGGGGGPYDGGGGGGSFVNSEGYNVTKQAGGRDRTPDNGFVTYQFSTDVNLVDAPIALCKDVVLTVDAGQVATITPADVDDGSYDPNDRPITMSICNVCTEPSGCSEICSPSWGWGCSTVYLSYSRVLKVDNGVHTSTCLFTVETEEGTPEPISCPPDIIVDPFEEECAVNLEDGTFMGDLEIRLRPESLGACFGILTYELTTPDGQNVPADVSDNEEILEHEFSTGTTTIEYTFEEDVNLTSSSCSFTVTVNELVTPTLSCPSDVTTTSELGVCTATLTSELAPAWTDNCTSVLSYSIPRPPIVNNDGITIIRPPLTGEGVITTYDFKANTSTTISYFIDDLGGRIADCSFTVSVADEEAPVARCLTGSIYDVNDPNQTLVDQIDNGSSDNCEIVGRTLDKEFDCDDIRSDGYSVTLTVADAAGNESTCSAVVRIRDRLDPTAVCQDITVGLANGQATITPDQVDGGSTDNCGIEMKSLDRTSFSCADIGEQDVLLTVTDARNHSASCTAVVTITEAPVARCQDVSVYLDENGSASITTMQIDDGSSYPCSNAMPILSLDQTAFDCSHIGEQTVVLTASDGAGNSTNCNATVTVEDQIAPTAVCQDVTMYLSSPTLNAEQLDAGSDDNCTSQANLTLFLAVPETGEPYGTSVNFNCFSVGDFEIQLDVFDESSNLGSCVATVNLIDDVLPLALCRDITIQLDDDGNGSTTAAAIDDGSSDACGIASLTLNKSAFSCDEVGDQTVVLTVTDVNGNTATCSASVTIEDNTPPTASCRDATIYLDENGLASLTPAQVNDGFADACGITSLSLNQMDFDCSHLGDQTVALSASDAAGNSSSCNATITVLDNEDPEIQLAPAAKLWPPDYSYQTFTIEDMAVGIEDNCAPSSGLASIWIDRAISDEAEDAPGTQDGNTLNDMVIAADCRSVQLRRERMGGGNGRVYTIVLAIQDEGGNISYADYKIQAPQWAWGWGGEAVEDAPLYEVVGSCNPNGGAAFIAPDIKLPASSSSHRFETSLNVYPNPFSAETNIQWYVPASAPCILEIFNIQGQSVRRWPKQERKAGTHQLKWKGVDDGGQPLSSGLYILRIKIGEQTLVKKLSLQRD